MKPTKNFFSIFRISVSLGLLGLTGTILIDNWGVFSFGVTIKSLLRELTKTMFISGTITVFLQLYFKKLTDIQRKEDSERQLKSIEALENSIFIVTKKLQQSLRALNTLSNIGVVEIFENRYIARNEISNVLMDQENKSIQLMGISLHDFIKSNSIFYQEWLKMIERLKFDSAFKLKLLILNPCSEQAIYRSECEESREISHREKNLFIEVKYILESLYSLINKSNLEALEIRIYDSSPSCFLMITNKYAFVEQYCYQCEIKTGFMPIIKYEIESKIGKDIKDHYDYIWNKAKEFKHFIIENHIGVAEATKTTGIINIFQDRAELTKRIKYLVSSTSNEILLMGNSLPTFTYPSYDFISCYKNRKEKIPLRYALLNPLSVSAKYIAVKECKETIDTYTLEAHKTRSNLYKAIEGSIRDIKRLLINKYPVELKLFNSSPSCFLFITDESVLVEQYHYGQIEDNVIAKRAMPVFEYKSDSTVYLLLRDHFEYVWNSCSISLGKFEELKTIIEKEFDNNANNLF